MREYCYSLARVACSAPPTNGCRVFQREHSRRGREAEEAEVGGKWGAPRTRSHESDVGAAPAKKTKAASTKEHLHNPFDTPSQVLAPENFVASNSLVGGAEHASLASFVAMKHIDQADRRLRHDAHALLCAGQVPARRMSPPCFKPMSTSATGESPCQLGMPISLTGLGHSCTWPAKTWTSFAILRGRLLVPALSQAMQRPGP